MTENETKQEEQETGTPGIIRFYMMALTMFLGVIFGAVLHIIVG
jgi:hypothetical protein